MDTAVLIFGAFVVFVVVLMAILIPLSIRAERRRVAGLAQWAAANGWTMTKNGRADWTGRMPGRNKRGLTVNLTGQLDGRRVTVADYHYTTRSTSRMSTSSSSSSTTTHYYIAIVVHLDRAHPPVAVVPRGVFSQLGRSLFGDKPTATGNPDFDSRFRIASPDPAYARWLVGPPLIAAHLACALPHWNLAGHDLLTFRTGRLPDPKSIPALATPLLQVANLLPR